MRRAKFHQKSETCCQSQESTYSSQEWCGHVFQETKLQDSGYVMHTNSYFEGESGREVKSFSGEEDLLFGDSFFLAVRGFGIPFIRPGATKKIKYLSTSEIVRLRHQPQKKISVTWTMHKNKSSVKVAAGEFEVYESRLVGKGFDAKVWVEAAFPHKIIRWQFAGIEGESGELRATRRAQYWTMLTPNDEKELPSLGLKPIGSLIQ